MKTLTAVCLLLVAYIVGFPGVFAALDWLDAALKGAYAEAAPRLDQAGRDLKRSYRDAKALHEAQRRGVAQ